MEDKLIGALIGIARATDGSEHLITAQSTAFLRRALKADVPDAASLAVWLKEAEAVKRAMVPDCFHCANPCGRTSDYDMKEMLREPESVRSAKRSILNALRSGATLSDGALYRGLFAVGLEGYSAEELLEIFDVNG